MWCGVVRRWIFLYSKEKEMADTAYVVLILAGFGMCMLTGRMLHSRGEQR